MRTHIVSHTHWDREWYLTYEQFRHRLVALIDRLLDLMDSQPEYRYFHLDGQTIVLEDYLELRPHQEARLRQLIRDGRILIGPWYDMPDEFLVSGESLVRNLALGHRVARRFGTPMPVGYLPDLFGHVSQMPQILRHFGLDNAILWRGFGGPRAEYWWQAPDGSRVLMMHLPAEGYCNATRVHLDPAVMVERATKAIQHEASRTSVGEMLLMNGLDHVEPHPVIPSLARQLTDALGAPVIHSTLPAYVDAVRAGVARAGDGSLDVVHGELRGGEDYTNLLPGVFSARVYLKQANARVQTLLEKRAEPLASFAWMLGAPYPAEELRYAWKTLLQNHPHDSICGCSIDPVHEENMTRFARAEQVAQAVVDDAADVIARAVPPGPEGALRLLAINTTGHLFSGVIETTIDLPYESNEPRRVVDAGALGAPVVFWPKTTQVTSIASADGTPLPFEVLSEEAATPLVMSRYESPWALRARRLRLAFIGEVPACGHATFDLALGRAAAPVDPPRLRTTARTAENALVRLTINDDGTFDVLDRATGACYPRCGELEDVADVGDEYNYSPPPSDVRVTSSDAADVCVTQVHAGPIRAEFRIELTLPVPTAITSDRTARSADVLPMAVTVAVSLDADAPSVGVQVTVDNRSRDHRLRMLFPVGADPIAEVRAETAFGVARRPARRPVPDLSRIEVPVSYGPTASFTEAGGATGGAIVFGDGLMEYEALADAAGHVRRLGLTLLRCVGYLSRADLVLRPSGHAGPGLATPGAQCPGRHEFRMAFEPRRQPPSNATLFAKAASFMSPPHVIPAVGAGGTLPSVGAFVTLGPPGSSAVLSACHKSHDRDSLIIRCFNPDGTPAGIRIGSMTGIRQAHRVNFLEERHGEVPVVDGAAEVHLGPHQISTIELTSGDV